jgi:hypothetical protein
MAAQREAEVGAAIARLNATLDPIRERAIAAGEYSGDD